MLDLMALYKLNGFHWHLTENQVCFHELAVHMHALQREQALASCCGCPFVYKMLDLMALCKLNRFHLTED